MVHFKTAVRVLIYLRDSADRVLVFRTDTKLDLEVLVDSSWATRFSCSGGMLFYHGSLFHWFSKMQRSVSLSSAKAEFFGAMLAAKEIVFVRELLCDLDRVPCGPTPLRTDSKSTVDLSNDPVAFKKTKHILRAAEFLRDLVVRQVVVLTHLPGKQMVADVLTKACARAVFIELLKLLDTYSCS